MAKRGRDYLRKQRERIIKKRKKLIKDTNFEHPKVDEEGRYSKQHPYDCGNSKCGICSPHKKNKASKSKLKDKKLQIEDIEKDEMKNDMCDFGD